MEDLIISMKSVVAQEHGKRLVSHAALGAGKPHYQPQAKWTLSMPPLRPAGFGMGPSR